MKKYIITHRCLCGQDFLQNWAGMWRKEKQNGRDVFIPRCPNCGKMMYSLEKPIEADDYSEKRGF